MSAVVQEKDWFTDLVQRTRHIETDQPHWLNKARAAAQQDLATLPRPGRKQEAWRYTNLDALLKTEFVPAPDELEVHEPEAIHWIINKTASYRLLFINGRLQPDFNNIALREYGVQLGSLRSALTTHPRLVNSWFNQAATETANVFSALNTVLLNDGMLLHVPKDVRLDKPIEVIYATLGEAQPLACQLRNLIVLEAGAEATLIEHFLSPGAFNYFNNSVSEVLVEDGAHLTHYRVQDESRAAFHVAQLNVRQAQDSHYRNVNIALGGSLARTELNVKFAGTGAHSELDGLYVVGDGQQIDHHLDIAHNTPQAASRANYKGILLGRGRAVFDGRIVVAKDAQQSDAHLTNKNLLLTRDAEVDTKPQLEIYADNVKCSHGTTVGQIDPNQLFYLRARGIDAVQAQQMLCVGFAGEILEQIDNEMLREHVSNRLLSLLGQKEQVS